MTRVRYAPAIVTSVLVAALAACAWTPAPRALAVECSGVPGDFVIPNAPLPAAAATHGQAAPGEPVRIQARVLPPHFRSVPPLYVFGPEGEFVRRGHRLAAVLAGPAFVDADRRAFWGELVDDQFHEVPEVDACMQAAMLDTPVSFRAPAGGLLFMQYLAPDCARCETITHAIQAVIDDHPELPVRWVQVRLPASAQPPSD